MSPQAEGRRRRIFFCCGTGGWCNLSCQDGLRLGQSSLYQEMSGWHTAQVHKGNPPDDLQEPVLL